MNKILYLIVTFFVLTACNSEDGDMDDALLNSSPEMTEEENIKGDFVSDAHPTSGMVSVNEEKSVLTLNNFKTDDGPKLLLYLTTDLDVNDYVDLGDLKGIEGDFEYDIPSNTDLIKYKYVVVWCVDFSVSFGHAELE
jgi:hypothetical protein